MTTTAPAPTGEPCPTCATTTVALEHSDTPWCPACRWGLDRYDPVTVPWRGSRWLGRLGYTTAFRLDDGLRRALVADPTAAARRSRAELVLVAISALIVLASLACFVGAVLVWRTEWLIPVRFGVSVGLVLLGMFLRPRFDRVPRRELLRAEGAPNLRELLRRVAAEVGTPSPELVIVSPHTLNLAVGRSGLRGRPVLVIGLPLWLLLSPAMRQALLAHELGHLVNRDPLRSALTGPAQRIFANAVTWTGGQNPWRRLGDDLDRAAQPGLGVMLVRLLLALVNTVFATVQLAIDAVIMPDHRRAEYAADLVARDVAGTAATVAALDRLNVLGELTDGLVHDVVTRGPTDWLALADRREALLADGREVVRQATRRRVDLWATHPPSGMRASLVELLPEVPGRLEVDAELFARIDTELSLWYDESHRAILGAREFLG
ncbi:M48 family metallopeptidase [Intrasporangium sp. YIM S08009]|uniref:M48 family metallopeptidase n=1 Tax=Intrasporangium zincisolvens TaxID=3080018 RepID=UPI002B059208|nr:M48 family metallopeptidase [Intrasporangium sp. YIM S08009]